MSGSPAPSTRALQTWIPPLIAGVVGVVPFIAVTLAVQRIPGGDDYIFARDSAPFDTVFAWVAHRYEIWSGRIFPEAFLYFFSPAPLALWKLVTILLFVAFVALLYAYLRLCVPAAPWQRNVMMVLVACALLFLLDAGTVTSGAFWVTGSMNYFWLIPFALAAFYPVARFALRGRLPPWYVSAIAFVSGFVAASSQEQIGAVLLVLVVIALGRQIARAVRARATRDAHLWYFGALTAVVLAGFVILMLAPGNSLRMAVDALVWRPDYYTTPFAERLHYGLRFVVDALVNRGGVALASVWTLLLVAVAVKARRNRWDVVVIVIGALGLTTVAMRALATSAPLFDFYATWKPTIPGVLPYVVLIFWTALLVLTSVAPAMVFRNQRGVFFSLLLLAALAAVAVITQSASMYASGPRILFVPSMLMLLSVFGMLARSRAVYVIGGSLLFVAAYQWVFVYDMVVDVA